MRHATVIYCTHIFDGLEGWASHIALIQGHRLARLVNCLSIPELAPPPPQHTPHTPHTPLLPSSPPPPPPPPRCTKWCTAGSKPLLRVSTTNPRRALVHLARCLRETPPPPPPPQPLPWRLRICRGAGAQAQRHPGQKIKKMKKDWCCVTSVARCRAGDEWLWRERMVPVLNFSQLILNCNLC
jgi:hypothetical protein